MKSHSSILIVLSIILLFCVGIAYGWGNGAQILLNQDSNEKPMQEDSVNLRYKIKNISPLNEKDWNRKGVDLKTPQNIEEKEDYDERLNQYKLGTKIGDSYLNTPILMSSSDYMKWSLQKSMQAYYQEKNAELYKAKGKEKFDFTDIHFDLGPAEKIFGPGGVQIKTQGSAELKLGANIKSVENPSLPLRYRNTFGFDFDEKVNLSVNGKIGDKMNMTLNYNTEATFDVDSKDLKLSYEGKEDEIIKLLEGGNVSMPSNLSLIQGSNSLFGIRADMQFGKLKLQTVVAKKNSTSKSTRSSGGNQLSNYELSAADYEENRHFFLAHFFRDNYDRYMAQLPNITSGITINRVEVWVTNKTGVTNNTRNIIAFVDLGESKHISNSYWTSLGSDQPRNGANTLYSSITDTYVNARTISQTGTILDGIGMVGGTDYEKLESARLLSSSEYNVNTALGYISLKSTLQTDQVLAVAYEYTYMGQSYQVGEFSTDVKDNTKALYVKSLKNTANIPQNGNWNLMMKNVYSLNATSVQKDRFRLDVKYLSDTTGVYLSYLPEANLKSRTLIRLLNIDRLDNNNKANPNGYFDYIEGYTINSTTGRVYLPAAEPFGHFLASVIGDDATAKKYVFQELYDSTKTIAKQIAEKNKFIISGQYKASKKSGEISLGTMDVPQGSVVVTAGGVTLVEGVDYTVNYSEGTVTIINQSILDAGTSVNVSLESNSDYGLERKTLLGLNWQYEFNKNFQIGGTLMHLSEQSLTTKTAMGSEPLNNTIWGVNFSWKQESQWLTDMLDKLPFLRLTAPSNIKMSAEFAQLIAGNNSTSQGNASYIDDFENTKNSIDISTPVEWSLCSTPSSSKFPESKYSNDVRYGYNRARLAWYKIDPLFTRRSSSLTPSHIKSDLEQLSNHYVREVSRREVFPNKEQKFGESSTISVLNLAYYPSERGPYNLDPDVNPKGLLTSPQKRWGGMMRKLNTSDFETANIEYIEFWMLDPFIYTRDEVGNYGGDLYFNLGEISEDILKDGKKYYESGMPLDGDPTKYTETVWGRVPSQNSVTYAFNTSSGARDKQDLGLNGLSSKEELTYSTYATYLDQIKNRVNSDTYDSISVDPAGDDYHYFRGSDYDKSKVSILDRYKRINNPEGNSAESSSEKFSTAYKTTPDVEDINQDYTLNEYEKYFEYHVHLAPEDMQVGRNYIVDQRTASVKLRNGKEAKNVNWYLFRIPISEYERKEGNINDFSSIRFMRVYLTNFEQPIVLRLATFDLVRADWRTYEQNLYSGQAPDVSGTIEVSAVNIEENNEKKPVNYVLPPGISRVVDPNQSQLLEQNEQALSLVVKNLAMGDARAVYKTQNLDLRRYKHIQMFSHANALIGDETLEDGNVSMFIRFGSDYRSNFYEYEIPLKLTSAGTYDRYSTQAARSVWPDENMLDIDLSLLTKIKQQRNKQMAAGLASYSQLFSAYDPDRPNNKISVMGNPSLGEIRTIMIGVRNNSRTLKSVEVWVNELRLQNYSNKGGWAAKGNLNLQLSDLGVVNVDGHVETEGFGGLEDRVDSRRDNNLYQYGITTSFELGKFFPEKAKVKAPIYYSYSKEKTVPKYNPLDTDLELDDALDALSSKHDKDSLRNIATHTVVNSNFSLSNARVDISTKGHPMPYDPANFSFSYSHSHKQTTGETVKWEKDDAWKWNLNYHYSPVYKSFAPFSKMKSRNPWYKILREEKINYLPQSITFNSDISRTYYELQERDLDQLTNTLPLTWASDFLWNRQLSINWDFTSNIHATYTSATNAEIQQPYVAVNKDLYPTEYEAWKDSVWHSIKNLGTPLSYQQNFNLSWKIPINKIPLFNWITSDWSYASTYSWQRGTKQSNGTSLGNTIANSRTLNGNLRVNMETLYNHIPFLKKTNQRFSSKSSSQNKKVVDKKAEAAKRNFVQEINLLSDTTVTLVHNKKTKRLRVQAIRPNGQRYPIKYKILDANKIMLLNRDTATLKLTVIPSPSLEEQKWYKLCQIVARVGMLVRSVNVTYKNSYNMSVPGFIPNIGDMFGQRSKNGLQPGLDFAFGLTGGSYIRKAFNKGWLLSNDSVTTPAGTNSNESLQIRATLEPFPDFKIDLTASRTVNKTRTIQYMYDGMPETQVGSFSMTTISLKSAFSSIGKADNNYNNKTFNKFVRLLDSYRDRVESRYIGSRYPVNSTLAGQQFDPSNGTIDKYSSDVMIPAFLSAYSGGSSLDLFPSLLRLLPNWRITYSGLAKLAWMRDHFKSFNINHSYQSIYEVGSYNTYNSFMKLIGDRGFVPDATSGNPIPSSMYDISTVTITENFSPFFGVDMTFQSGLTAKLEYNRSRLLSLSMTSQQLNETRSNDWVLGVGYKLNDVKLFTGWNKKKRTKQKNRKKDNTTKTAKASSKTTGFSNDLNIRLDFSLRDQSAIQRNILTMNSQATSGNKAIKLSFSADYTLSKLLTLSAYYDRQTNKPLLSSSSYPTTTQDFGISMKFSLTR